MFKIAVGNLGFTPAAFYSSSPYEIGMAIEGFNNNKKENFYLSQTMMINSIGVFFGGKKFKPVDPFIKEKVHEVVTLESKSETFEYLRNKFERR
ncbi:MAG: hypothetical protein GX947_02700 [Tissierellia bacterium]|nr:hypothetical protein [Tissierellia bacterium]